MSRPSEFDLSSARGAARCLNPQTVCGGTNGWHLARKENEMAEMIVAQLVASFIIWLITGSPVCS
jgi:hypothetical protein